MRSVFFVCLLLAVVTATAQKNYRAAGVYTSLVNGAENFQSFFFRGTNTNYTLQHGFLGGIETSRGISKLLKLNIGIEYSSFSIQTTTTGFPNPFYKTGEIKTLSVPVYLRLDFLKYLFITGGAIVDVQLKNDIIKNQSGIGATGGFGFKYDFKSPVTIYLHPFYQLHTIIPFAAYTNDRLLNVGLKAGINYRFR